MPGGVIFSWKPVIVCNKNTRYGNQESHPRRPLRSGYRHFIYFMKLADEAGMIDDSKCVLVW